MRAAAALAAIACALGAAGAAGGAIPGNSYLADGHDYDFTLVNAGTAAWHSFYLVAPAGTSFVGGTTGNEASATCVVGPADRLECGPLSPSTMPPGGSVSFVATTTTTASCGPAFALFVSADGVSYVDAGDLVAAPACGAQAPRALTQPALRGTAKVGATLHVAAPRWSAPPSSVAYRWERCTPARCAAIAGAAGRSLLLTRADAGHAIRVVVAATIAGRLVRASSPRVFVRAAT